jgi:hypothetical protein
MPDEILILDYTRTPQNTRLELYESPDGILTLTIRPLALWMTWFGVTAIVMVLVAGIGILVAFAIWRSRGDDAGVLFVAGPIMLVSGAYALSLFLNRHSPTILRIGPDLVLLERSSWGRRRIYRVPRERFWRFHLRQVGLGLSFRSLGELWILRRWRLPICVCRCGYAGLSRARARLSLAVQKEPAGFPVVLNAAHQRQ